MKEGNFDNIAIVGHSSIDPDSIASAFGMEFIVKELHSSINVDVLVDGISKHTSKVMEYFDKEYKVETTSKYDLIIIVDVNVPSQLGKFLELIQSHDKKSIIILTLILQIQIPLLHILMKKGLQLLRWFWN